jgi:hypothetical protein
MTHCIGFHFLLIPFEDEIVFGPDHARTKMVTCRQEALRDVVVFRQESACRYVNRYGKRESAASAREGLGLARALSNRGW